jgi:hypothetical protein
MIPMPSAWIRIPCRQIKKGKKPEGARLQRQESINARSRTGPLSDDLNNLNFYTETAKKINRVLGKIQSRLSVDETRVDVTISGGRFRSRLAPYALIPQYPACSKRAFSRRLRPVTYRFGQEAGL